MIAAKVREHPAPRGRACFIADFDVGGAVNLPASIVVDDSLIDTNVSGVGGCRGHEVDLALRAKPPGCLLWRSTPVVDRNFPAVEDVDSWNVSSRYRNWKVYRPWLTTIINAVFFLGGSE